MVVSVEQNSLQNIRIILWGEGILLRFDYDKVINMYNGKEGRR